MEDPFSCVLTCKKNPCSFWMWGDVQPPVLPMCRHGFLCVSRKVKKEGVNKGSMFFCCANEKEDSCRFFEWAPEEKRHGSLKCNFQHFNVSSIAISMNGEPIPFQPMQLSFGANPQFIEAFSTMFSGTGKCITTVEMI
jgi:hypothetical protein